MIVVAPTAFKGTLSPQQAARIMARATKSLFPRIRIVSLPLADGGDGTLDVLMSALNGRFHRVRVKGPMGGIVSARWGRVSRVSGLRGPVGIIEMAEASGLRLVQGKKRILDATTEGTGQLIRAAIRSGCKSILIGVGGTAASDGGAGALSALGFRLLDSEGRRLSPSPRAMSRLAAVDGSRVPPSIRNCRIVVLCDVTNPLLGPNGSARVFGPQKGATPKDVVALERILKTLARCAPRRVHAVPGSGAAGGLAFGLSAYLNARLCAGGPFLLKVLDWSRRTQSADLILTGEGRLDHTSFSGKVVGAVAARRGRARVVVVCGATPLTKAQLKKRGIDDVQVMGKRGLLDPEKAVFEATRKVLLRGFRHPGEGRGPI